MLIEREQLPVAQASLILLDGEMLNLYDVYRKARAERDAERDTFRVSKDITTIEGALAKAKADIAPIKASTQGATVSTSNVSQRQ
jgi:transcription antitermination factor NusG